MSVGCGWSLFLFEAETFFSFFPLRTETAETLRIVGVIETVKRQQQESKLALRRRRSRQMSTLTMNFSKKISTRFKLALAGLGCFAICSRGCYGAADANAQGNRYSLTVRNYSRYRIDRLYMSASDENLWGPDQLGRHTIYSDSQFTLTNIRPGEYDIRDRRRVRRPVARSRA